MKNRQNPFFSGKFAAYSIILTAVFSFAVIVATFFISNSTLAFETKTAIFLTIVFIYPILCAGFYFWQRANLADSQTEDDLSVFDTEIEEKLFALEEANEFFGASLKFSDMFRLVSSRIGEIVPYSACLLLLRGDSDENLLQIKYAVGENAQKFTEFKFNANKSLAAKAFLSGKTEIDSTLLYEKGIFSPEILEKFQSAAAVPLLTRGENFGVLVLYGARADSFGGGAETLLNAVSERVAPLFANSFAFEQSVSNALTDSLTNLPNERGFFLVLENQLAESIRYREERPLTVLAMDIRNFDEINQKYGHTAGDRLLEFAASIIKKQLRQMDVLTRFTGDEFLAILPTANEKIGEVIVERISRAFVLNRLQISDREKINLELNFGAATFWRDGETANQLLKTALLRKEQDKTGERNNVIWFPKEFVN
jgi:diguanylate cyclase (GGDEF)-like protein